MIVVETYSNRLTAELARNRLAACGVTALVHADNGGGMRPDLELTLGVRLLVAADAATMAREILDDETVAGPRWRCDFCGETLDPHFDACWQCGQPRA